MKSACFAPAAKDEYCTIKVCIRQTCLHVFQTQIHGKHALGYEVLRMRDQSYQQPSQKVLTAARA